MLSLVHERAHGQRDRRVEAAWMGRHGRMPPDGALGVPFHWRGERIKYAPLLLQEGTVISVVQAVFWKAPVFCRYFRLLGACPRPFWRRYHISQSVDAPWIIEK